MWRIVPLILLGYLMAYMDRVNVSLASLQMNSDLKFSASIYGLGAGLFFLAYAMFEVPSSLMLRRYSAPQWVARIMFTWGLLAAGMMFVRTSMQFYVMRFLLGAAEAGFFPTVIYYFSGWFPMHRHFKTWYPEPLTAITVERIESWKARRLSFLRLPCAYSGAH
jgi:ACS family tartrate transporter-like MFS transporter